MLPATISCLQQFPSTHTTELQAPTLPPPSTTAGAVPDDCVLVVGQAGGEERPEPSRAVDLILSGPRYAHIDSAVVGKRNWQLVHSRQSVRHTDERLTVCCCQTGQRYR